MTRFNTSSSALADLSASLNEGGSLPTEDALVQLGRALMTELIDVISDTALEDFQTILGEALIGAFHSAAGRIERRCGPGARYDAIARPGLRRIGSG